MASFVVLLVPHTRELSLAELAFIWLLTSVSAHVYHQVPLLRESPIAIWSLTLEEFESRMYCLEM